MRPVPYWGVVERVLYRALTEAALDGLPEVDRSADAYLRFVKAPVSYAWELQRKRDAKRKKKPRALLHFLESPVKYVVKSDLTAFYQFVDHTILGEELVAQGADFDVVEALIELLGEVQGRGYGLPQLLDASDALSEVYVDRVERWLIRQGYAVWRFNDDFRIACETYLEALGSIEALDSACRSVGLAINELKTFTYGFTNYMIDSLSLVESDLGETIAPDEVEETVGDYTDDFGEDPDAALKRIESAKTRGAGKEGINLRRATNDDVRLLRRAIAALAGAEDPRALDHITRLVIYIPSLTPSAMRYLLVFKDKDEAQEQVGEVLDELIERASLNDWQRVWLCFAIEELALLEPDGPGDVDTRLRWVWSCFRDAEDEPLRGSALRTLVGAGQVDFPETVKRASRAPAAMLTTYLSAVLEAADSPPNPAQTKQLRALEGTNNIYKALLKG